MKESGFGREGGTEGIEEYLNTKYIALELIHTRTATSGLPEASDVAVRK